MDQIKLNDFTEDLERGSLSDELKNRIIEHRIELEDEKIKNTWQSCCITLDKRACQYFTQMAVLIGVMGFSVGMLLTHDTCTDQQAYLSLLMMLIGLVIPAPTFDDTRKK